MPLLPTDAKTDAIPSAQAFDGPVERAQLLPGVLTLRFSTLTYRMFIYLPLAHVFSGPFNNFLDGIHDKLRIVTHNQVSALVSNDVLCSGHLLN